MEPVGRGDRENPRGKGQELFESPKRWPAQGLRRPLVVTVRGGQLGLGQGWEKGEVRRNTEFCAPENKVSRGSEEAQ